MTPNKRDKENRLVKKNFNYEYNEEQTMQVKLAPGDQNNNKLVIMSTGILL